MQVLYLAHNLDDRHWIREWEIEAEKRCHIKLINPFYDCKRTDIKDIDSGKVTRWTLSYDRCKRLVKRDLKAIDRSQGILAFVNGSIGTTLEIGYARATGKQIFIISEKFYNHPWLRVYATKRFKTKEEFEKWLQHTVGVKDGTEKSTK